MLSGQDDSFPSDIVRGKVVFAGPVSVGKTAIIQKFQGSDINSSPTIGVNSIKCVIKIDSDDVVLNVWDTAGQDEYKNLMPAYARGAEVAVIVFDMSNKESFQKIDEYVQYFVHNVPKGNLIIVGNKIDLRCEVNDEEIVDFVGEKFSFFKTSALLGEGIDNLFYEISQKVLDDNDKVRQSSEQSKIVSIIPNQTENLNPQTPTRSKSCC